MRVFVLCLALGFAAAAGCATPGAGERLVVLLTDFGTGGSYVGSLEGAIYRSCPGVRIDEITHEVSPFDIEEGARILREAAFEYPPGTVFVAVVDPGVGTERRAIAALDRRGVLFVAPDNGILSLALNDSGVEEVREIDPSRLPGVRPTPSSTFHGRDIFGPAAGLLACGGSLSDLGPKRSGIVKLVTLPPRAEGKKVQGRISSIDRYGNILTDIPMNVLRDLGGRPGEILQVRLGSLEIECPWVKTYGDVPVGDILCLENSQGLLEIAENQRNLAARIGVARGGAVEVSAR